MKDFAENKLGGDKIDKTEESYQVNAMILKTYTDCGDHFMPIRYFLILM